MPMAIEILTGQETKSCFRRIFITNMIPDLVTCTLLTRYRTIENKKQNKSNNLKIRRRIKTVESYASGAY